MSPDDALTDQYRALAGEEGRENQTLREEKAQLLDVKWRERYEEHLERAEKERDALGERCRQLEAALRGMLNEYHHMGHKENSPLGRAHAALGDSHPSPMVTDTPAPPETEEQYDERTGAFYEDDGGDLTGRVLDYAIFERGDTPPRTTDRPSQESLDRLAKRERKPAVEPPQPSPRTERDK